MTKTKIYDPPSGWKYGFPRPYLPKEGETLRETLLRDGYPEKEFDKTGEPYWCRFWDSSMTNEELTEIEALRNTILDQLAYHETAQDENARLKDEVAKLRQRLVIRENLRERIAQLNTQLAIARAGSTHLKEK